MKIIGYDLSKKGFANLVANKKQQMDELIDGMVKSNLEHLTKLMIDAAAKGRNTVNVGYTETPRTDCIGLSKDVGFGQSGVFFLFKESLEKLPDYITIEKVIEGGKKRCIITWS